MDAQARIEVLTGVTVGRLNLELRGAQLALRLSECHELREQSRALVAESQQVYDRVAARRAAGLAQSGGPASP